MSDISIFVAFLGGALSLLPACGPALVPAFFAMTFLERKKLVLAVVSFAVGFGLVFIPFILGVNAVANTLSLERNFVLHIVGVILILFGIASLFGWRFRTVSAPRVETRHNFWNALLLGLTFGFTSGACSGPIFGAIATLALASGNTFQVIMLGTSFLVGMFVPLLVLALILQRYGFPGLKRLATFGISFTIRGREYRFFISNILAGVLFIVFGLFYLFTTSDGYWSVFGTGPVLDWFFKASDALLK